MRRRDDAEIPLGLLTIALLVVLGALPIARLVVTAADPAALHAVIASPSVQRALLRSVVTSLGGGLVALLLGGGMALALQATDVRGRRVLAVAALLPLLVPSQIVAIAWIALLSPSSWLLGLLHLAPAPGAANPVMSPTGIVLLLGFEHAPIVFLALRAALMAIPARMIEAAWASGARDRIVLRRVVLPLAAPGLAAGLGLAVVGCLGNFGIPALLGIPARYPTLAVLIYQRLSGFGLTALPEAAAMALLLGILALVTMPVALLPGRRMAPLDAGSSWRFTLGAWRAPITALCWAAIGATVLLPMLALLAGSLARADGVALTPDTATLAHYARVLAMPAVRRGVLWSAALGMGAGVCGMALALPLALTRIWSRRVWLRGLSATAFLIAELPYALPGVVLAIGMILLLLRPVAGVSLYGTSWIILLAYVARFLPLALRPVQAALRRADRRIADAAELHGAAFMVRLRRVLLPMLAPAVLSGLLLVALTAFGELTVSSLLWSPGHETVGVIIYSLNESGDAAGAQAVSVLCLLVVFIAALAATCLPSTARRLLPWM